MNTTDEVMDDIQAKSSAALMIAMGYNMKMPTAIGHGPIHLGGAGMINLVAACNSSKVNHIVQHLRAGILGR
jgi:uncharacterized membrane protein